MALGLRGGECSAHHHIGVWAKKMTGQKKYLTWGEIFDIIAKIWLIIDISR
jgi:hypothetical protein